MQLLSFLLDCWIFELRDAELELAQFIPYSLCRKLSQIFLLDKVKKKEGS